MKSLNWTTETNEWPDLAPVLNCGDYLIYKAEDGSGHAAVHDGVFLHVGTLEACKQTFQRYHTEHFA